MGMLLFLLNKKNDLSVRNGILLHNQVICPMMDWVGNRQWSSEDQRAERALIILLSGWPVALRTASLETCSNRPVVPAHTVTGLIGSPVSCVVYWISCRIFMLRKEVLAFIKATSTMQLSPAILKDLRMAMSRRKKSAVPSGSRSIITGCGARALNYHLPSPRASVKPTSWQPRAGHWSPQTVTRHLAIGPRLCPRVHR